jgi:hypothetical protein
VSSNHPYEEIIVPAPVESTYCSDPEAKFTVSSLGPDTGGIDGYYTNEFDAHRVATYYRARGHRNVAVEEYDPKAEVKPGMHHLFAASVIGM